jgi:hypothetical protein
MGHRSSLARLGVGILALVTVAVTPVGGAFGVGLSGRPGKDGIDVISKGAVAPGAATPSGVSVKVAAFETEPVVLTGADFPDWTSGPEATARVWQPTTDYEIYNSQGLLPAPLQSDCYDGSNPPENGYTDPNFGDHNCFQGSQLPIRTVLKGVPTDTLLGYQWDGATDSFVQIPFQVDPMWEHYLSNNASGFAFYSGVNEMLTYSFDSEPFLFTNKPVPLSQPLTGSEAAQACQVANPDVTTLDPNPGLINTDQMAFMARDAGPEAPSNASLPSGIVSANQVRLVDPNTGIVRFVYVMESALIKGSSGALTPLVAAKYTADNSPYVHYAPSSNADTYVFSQSNYNTYGNALYGPACNSVTGAPILGQGFKKVGTFADGAPELELDPSQYVQRRTMDTATVTTPRYEFQYGDTSANDPLAGRWIMDDLQVSSAPVPSGDNDQWMGTTHYGPSIINRFKARAFQQAPGGSTPCCGYEDEQVNWNGSSITMGIRVGPVRVIRVTWGADSGTNVTRTDIFYAYSMQHVYGLRVHPIPPLDGIYTQWDMSAGQITKYYNPENPTGVPVTGINPVLYGDTTDFIGPSGVEVADNSKLGRLQESLNGGKPLTIGKPNEAACNSPIPISIPVIGSPQDCIYGSFNIPDVTFSGLGGATLPLSWEELTGPGGTMVEKWSIDPYANVSAGSAQSFVEAVPYYVDDSCFDDGTGDGPGPQINPRGIDPTTWGFENVSGKPVAVSPAPTTNVYKGTVTKDGETFYYKDGSGPYAHEPYARRCWNYNVNGTPYNIPGTATYNPKKPAQSQDPIPDPNFGPDGDVRYFEGDIATHGLHLLFASDTANASLPVPIDEVDTTDYQAILPPDEGNIGAAMSAQFLLPILGVATPFPLTSATLPQPHIAGSGVPTTPISGKAGTGSSNPSATDNLLPLGSLKLPPVSTSMLFPLDQDLFLSPNGPSDQRAPPSPRGGTTTTSIPPTSKG